MRMGKETFFHIDQRILKQAQERLGDEVAAIKLETAKKELDKEVNRFAAFSDKEEVEKFQIKIENWNELDQATF